MTDSTFTRNYSTTATFETPLGTVHIVDSRNALEDREATWVYAEVAEAKFNFDPADRGQNFTGGFKINGREYNERIDISRTKTGKISVSAGRYGKQLTDAARKRLEEILAPLVEPLLPRLTEEDYWETVEGLVRGKVRYALGEVVRAAESELRNRNLTHYTAKQSNGANGDHDVERAYALAVKIINEEVGKLGTVKTLSGGFPDHD